MTTTTIQQAKINRDNGIRNAKQGEAKRTPEFFGKALKFVKEYAGNTKRGVDRYTCFLTEDIVAEWEKSNEPLKEGRAWGAVMRVARERGYVVSCGYSPAKTSNMSPKVLWRAG